MNFHEKHIENLPFLGDETLYPFMVGGPNLPARMEYMRYIDMHRQFRVRWGRLLDEHGWKCFFTHAQMHGYNKHLSQNFHLIPWGVSKEHLVPKRHKMFLELEYHPLVDDWSNKKLVGSDINFALGHDPLAVKAIVRQEMLKINFNREHPSDADANICHETLVAIKQNTMMTDDGIGFVWQEVNFDAENDKRKARLVFAEMLDIEREFLRMSSDERQDWLDSFRWKW